MEATANSLALLRSTMRCASPRKRISISFASRRTRTRPFAIMDYGKARFEQMKREKEQRKNQATIETKEIRLSSTIDTHDMEVKAKACIKFLKSGNKVKASIRFRGRQITHGDVGLDVMNAFYEMVQDYAVMERSAKQEGKNMTMILSPKPAPKN